jgi:2-isopropylmalate synthase
VPATEAGDPEVRRVHVFDTTLRDGEQAAGCGMSRAVKLALARQLGRAGVDVIEAGFPASSPADGAAVAAVAERFRRDGPVVCGLARAVPDDVDRCVEAVRAAARPRVHTFIATSDLHLTRKLRMTRAEVLHRAAAMVRRARARVAEVEFSAEDATRTAPEFLTAVLDAAVEAGAAVVNLPDTVGWATPDEYGALIGQAVARYAGAGVTVSAHCHDDLGLAVANTVAAVRAGAGQVECTVNGIGERAGNAALEEIAMLLRTRRDRLGADTGIVTGELLRTSRLVERASRMGVPPNKAVVGRNAFAHQSGIHQAGVLEDPSTYEVIPRAAVGFAGEAIVLGRLSGRRALQVRLERLGVATSGPRLDHLFERFKTVAARRRVVTDADLLVLLGGEGDPPEVPHAR